MPRTERTATSLAAPRKVGVGLIVLLGLLESFGPLSMDVYMPALPELARTLETSDAAAQLTMAVCMLGLGLGQLIAGPLSDRWGRRAPVLAGVFTFTVFSLACAWAPTIQWLLIFRALQGIGGSAGMVIALAIARDLFSGVQLARALAWLTVVGALTPVFAPLLGGLLTLAMDWRGVFVVLAGLGGLIFTIAALSLKESHPVHLRSPQGLRSFGADSRVLLRSAHFRLLLVISALSGMAFFTYLSMSSFVLQASFDLTPQAFSLVFTAGSVCTIVGAQLSRVCVVRTGSQALFLAGLGIAVLGGIIALISVLAGWGLIPFVIGFAVYVFSTGFTLPNGNTLALNDHGSRAGTAAALIGTASLVLGPMFAPSISLLGVTPVILAAAVTGTMICCLAIGMFGLRRSPDPTRTPQASPIEDLPSSTSQEKR